MIVLLTDFAPLLSPLVAILTTKSLYCDCNKYFQVNIIFRICYFALILQNDEHVNNKKCMIRYKPDVLSIIYCAVLSYDHTFYSLFPHLKLLKVYCSWLTVNLKYNCLLNQNTNYFLAKNGVTEAELEDILSCDDDVLNDVYMYWTPPIRRLPPLLLVRIRTDLSQYLGKLLPLNIMK